jgi:flagellar hook assembly protein FlgD
MKARIVFIILGMIILIGRVPAQEWQSPQQLGLHRAKVSDQAQIQLLINELRSAEANQLQKQIILKRFAAGQNVRFVEEKQTIQKRSDQLPEIVVEGKNAWGVFPNGDRLVLQKDGGQWRIKEGKLTVQKTVKTGAEKVMIKAVRGFSAGETFIPAAVSEEYGIKRLTRQVTRVNLDRSLFGAPEKTASYYVARYSNNAPYVVATYIQLVTDPAWNRILYGSLGRWIKSYNDVTGPSAIAVDANGRVFVGEPGRQRIVALQLRLEEEDTELDYLFDIPGISHPADLALDDNGTPLKTGDDLLYIADPVQNKILKYALDANSATLIAEFDGFDTPAAVLAGKWNGANNGFIYMIDKTGRRIQLLEDTGTALVPLHEIIGDPGQYFSAVKTDHFGNIYLVDNINSRLFKYSAGLELLDSAGGKEAFEGLVNVDIGFGKIIVEGEGAYRAGFDQLFTLERWSDQSGVQRHTLGTAIKNATFEADADISEITAQFTLTDFSEVSVQISGENNQLVAEIPSEWMASGRTLKRWNRRNEDGEQVPPGNYRYEIIAKSPYRDEEVMLSAQFYLPLYYWQDCGSDSKANDTFLVQGKPVKWGETPSHTAIVHPSAVIYRFSGLNPQSEYEVAVECFAGDGIHREQEVLAGAETFLGQVHAGEKPLQTGYIKLPKESYMDGFLTLSVVNREGGSAAASQIWLKETGAKLNPRLLTGAEAVPKNFVLEQNFPNPFNPATTIRFHLPRDGDVRLEVFNTLGQKVRVLVNENRVAGTHSLTWDGRNDAGAPVGSGIYFYRFVSSAFSETKRMLLLK